MLSWKQYTKAIDMWSVGCIFAELLGRKPLFPGRDYLHQLTLITDVIGTPTAEDIANIGSEQARKYIRQLPVKPKISFGKIYPNASPAALDLLEKMLVFDPDKRISCVEALAHPYLSTLHDPADEPMCPAVFSFEFENSNMTKRDIKNLIFNEVCDYNPGLREEEEARPKVDTDEGFEAPEPPKPLPDDEDPDKVFVA
jgi:serine/threonine protein kinase